MKPGGTLTLSAIVVDADRLPEVPVIVTVAGPVAAVLLAVNVSRLLPAAGFGLNKAVTPLGRLDALRATLPVNPYWADTVMESMADAPWTTERVAGNALSVKLGGGVTARERTVNEVSVPDTPEMVTE